MNYWRTRAVKMDGDFCSRLGGKVTSGQVKRAVAACVVEEMLPLSTVESQSFRDLLTMILVTDSSVPLQDRKTFARYLDKCYADRGLSLLCKKHFRFLRHKCSLNRL